MSRFRRPRGRVARARRGDLRRSPRGPEVVDYAVVLTVDNDGDSEIVRSYDGSHGVDDMHRHSRASGKAPAEKFHLSTLGEGMRAAITAVRGNHKEMIDAWRAT